MAPELILDLILAAGVIMLGILALSVQQLFTAIILYISLGLMATIIWARLDAWDVAIAEAAIGAGLTGALFLVAWRCLSGNALLAAEKKESDDVS